MAQLAVSVMRPQKWLCFQRANCWGSTWQFRHEACVGVIHNSSAHVERVVASEKWWVQPVFCTGADLHTGSVTLALYTTGH